MEQAESTEIYQFLDLQEEYKGMDTLPIKILVDPYKEIEFRFTRVSLHQENEDLHITFDTEILKNRKDNEVSLNDEEFVDFLGNILYDIVVNRTDITTQIEKRDEPVDLEADVHEDTNGKDHS